MHRQYIFLVGSCRCKCKVRVAVHETEVNLGKSRGDKYGVFGGVLSTFLHF